MFSRYSGMAFTALVAVALAVVILTSCGRQEAVSQQAMTPTPMVPPIPPTGSVGRYQILSIHDGDRGTVVMMLDTVEGASWIYRPPQGQAVNGFWSDIPRLTYAPEFWRQVFAQQQQQAQQAAPTTTNQSPPQVILPPAK